MNERSFKTTFAPNFWILDSGLGLRGFGLALRVPDWVCEVLDCELFGDVGLGLRGFGLALRALW